MPDLDGKPTTAEIRAAVEAVGGGRGGSLDEQLADIAALVEIIDDWIDEAYQRGKDVGWNEHADAFPQDWQS